MWYTPFFWLAVMITLGFVFSVLVNEDFDKLKQKFSMQIKV